MQSSPISSSMKEAMASISSGGQPWKVLSVTEPETAARKPTSRSAAWRSGICARSFSTVFRASFIPSMKLRTFSPFTPFRS